MKEFVPQQKIRDKFILVFVTLSLSILFAVGLVSTNTVKLVRIYDISQLELQLISQKIEEIEKFIGEIRGSFQLQVGFEELAEISLKDQDFLLKRLLDENDSLEDVSFLNLEGEEIFRRIRGREDYFKKPELKNQSDSLKFKEAKEGKDYLGPIHYKNGLPFVIISSPIYNRNREIISILTGELNLSNFQKLVLGAKLGNSGYIYIIDQEGNLIAHSEKPPSYLQNLKKTENSQIAKFIEDILRGRTRTGVEKEDRYQSFWGEKVIAAGTNSKYLGWAAVAEWPEKDAMNIVDTMTFQMVEFSLFAFAAIIAITIILVRQITKPLKELLEGVEIIGKGDFDHQIIIKTRDEIGELGKAFNKMACDLKELARLKEVEVRGKALAEALAREKELSQMKDKFITVASHQFRTPISVIRWILDLLHGEKDLNSKKVKGYLGDLHENTRKLAIITGDLLTVSEFGLGYHKKKKFQHINLNILISEVIDSYKSDINDKKINLEFQSSSPSLSVTSDMKAIREVIRNLINNAITYTKEKGKVMINLLEEAGKAKFIVTDTGIGIPEQEQKYIFSEFFRATNSVEQKNVGTGLGLYISKSIIDAYQGDIGFQSEEGRGSTFWFTLSLVH